MVPLPSRRHRDGIRAHIPDAKLIAVLRNPIERAYSAWAMLLGDGREPIGEFARALDAEGGRIRRGWEPIWHYTRMGFYAQQLNATMRRSTEINSW